MVSKFLAGERLLRTQDATESVEKTDPDVDPDVDPDRPGHRI